MEDESEKNQVEDWLKNLPLQSGNEGFAPEQMTDCPKCNRKNPPTRLKCLYCGEDLPVTEGASVKQLSRKLEPWEKGFNIIFLPGDENKQALSSNEPAIILRLEKEDLQKIIAAGTPLPLARAESQTEAEIISKNLKEKGIDSTVVSDEQLQADRPPRRLRGIKFSEDEITLTLFNADENLLLKREDICLIVAGTLFERKIESTQKYQRKKENKVLETTELSNDEALIDIYSREDSIGYRIESKGFDFSCLEDEKELLAARNMKRLLEKLKNFAPEAKFDDDYKRIRAELSLIWEVEEKKDSRGIQKKTFGQYNLESVTTINNLQQFTRYARLQRNLI